MLSRTFFVGAGRRRSSNAGLAFLSRLPAYIRLDNARYELQEQRRWLGFANVWVDESTAAARSRDFRRRRKFYSRRQVRDEWEPDEAKPKPPKPKVEVKEKLPYNWSRAKPKKDDPLKILNSGRILGRNRQALIRKYGKPTRISKKARLAKLEKMKHDREMALKPKKEAQDTGAVRRLREKRLDEEKAKRRIKQLKDRNLLPTTSADSSSPFMYKPDETRKLTTMFGEIDVTQAKRLRDYREKMKHLASSKAVETKQVTAVKAEKPVPLSSGSQEAAKLDARPSDNGAARRLREKSERASRSSKALANGNELAVVDPSDLLTVTEANLPAAAPPQTDEKHRYSKKMEQRRDGTVRNSSKKTKAAASMTTQELPKVRPGAQARTEDEKNKLPIQEKKMVARTTSLPSSMDVATRTTETEDLLPQTSQKHHLEAGRLEVSEITSSASPEALEQRAAPTDLFLLTGADRMELWKSEDLEGAAEEMAEEGKHRKTGKSELLTDDEVDGNESLRWTYNTHDRLTDTPEGSLLAKALGTDTLMDFPRLVRVQKPPKSKRKFAKPEGDEHLNPFELHHQSPFLESSKENALTVPAVPNPLEEIRRRNFMLRQELEEKAQKDYETMLRTNLASPPVKRKRASKRLIVDPNDDSFKRIDDSEPVPQLEKPLSNNAKFRLIQPPLDIMRYIDSQLLGRRRLEEWRKAGYKIKLHAPLDDVPFTKDENRHKIQQSVFRNPHLFVAAAKISTSIPPAELPEIAFAGRSNAGKSKLINALTRRYGTARTSPRPGTTRSINFYVLGKELCLVDLPGYSFMYGKEEEIEQIKQLTKDYITLRDELKRVCVLVSAEWGFQRTDREFVEFLESVNQKYQIILTKADKVSPRDLGRRTTQIYDMLKDKKCHVHPVLMVSARHGAGVGKLRMSLASVLQS